MNLCDPRITNCGRVSINLSIPGLIYFRPTSSG
jgi:hypothetical protein